MDLKAWFPMADTRMRHVDTVCLRFFAPFVAFISARFRLTLERERDRAEPD